jgi:hypothetical protein
VQRTNGVNALAGEPRYVTMPTVRWAGIVAAWGEGFTSVHTTHEASSSHPLAIQTM